jgi:hypothetical protein
LIHENLQKRMLAQLLVGAKDPWKHPDFRAFKAGFNCIEGRPFITNARFQLSMGNYQ